MHVGNQKNLLAGLMFTAVGSAFVVVGMQYSIGTAAEMGAGYFPTMLGGILSITGLIVAGKALSTRIGKRVALPSFDWPTILIILASIAFFAASLEKLGFALTTIGTVLIARLAGRPAFSLNSVLTAFILTAFSTLLFKYALDLPLPLWPSFDGR